MDGLASRDTPIRGVIPEVLASASTLSIRFNNPNTMVCRACGGSPQPSVASAQRISRLTGVYGLDLLAYRFDGDVPDLVQRVVQAVPVPVIAAGSVDSFERISTLASSGVWGFTIGSAIFEHCFGAGLAEQVEAVLAAVPTAANRAVML